MNLVDYIIKRFDGEILVPNQWRVDGSKGNKYTVEWDKFHKNYKELIIYERYNHSRSNRKKNIQH